MATLHVLGFSGGADSQAVGIWLRQRYPPEQILFMNTHAGQNECGVTVKFIEDYSRDVFPIQVVVPQVRDLGGVGTKSGRAKERRSEYRDDDEMTFAVMSYIEGRFPSRKAQFCTEHLKLSPQRRWLAENVIAKDPSIEIVRYVGVRRDESLKRADVPDEEYDKYFDCTLVRPIASWTKDQVFKYIHENGEAPNPLYKMGFSRVGCAPCINANKEDIRNWALRFPEMINKIRIWEQFVGRTFFAPLVPGKYINWIDEVVEWSKTQRGGRIPLTESQLKVESCSSMYGLCE
jgi:3'-phosphoadenosine 5'-phosphosulfate sulfotransferase (PAPS reductase)/FAD synthetase